MPIPVSLRIVGRYEHVAGMQGAVHDARLDREVEGGGQLGDHAHDVGRRDWCVPASGQVAGIGCHEIECQVGR